MVNCFEEISKLTDEILNYNITKKEVEGILNRMEEEYGKQIFPSIDFEKKPQPWNEKYLRELKEKNMAGAYSRDFILHMAEVSEKIAEYRKIKKILALIVISVVLLIILVVILL